MRDLPQVMNRDRTSSEGKPATSCQICSRLRPLAEHLNEAAEFCLYLGNHAEYSDGESTRTVRTEVIGDWLRLAARLEKVEINAWATEGDSAALYCGTVADRVDSDSKHFSVYSTALTRFIFVANALEETYRFIAHHHDQIPVPAGGRKPKTPAVKAAALLDAGPVALAEHHGHVVSNHAILFDRYLDEHRETDEALLCERGAPSHGLHMLRILRNHVAHGVFPLIPNPEYEGDFDRVTLLHLLNHSCRVGALYVQAFLGAFNKGFKSHEYSAIEGAYGCEFERFLANCTPAYALSLHLTGPFRLATWMEDSLKSQYLSRSPRV